MLPNELRARRIAAGWSKQQLASRVGVTEETVSSWESGDRPIEIQRAVEHVLVTRDPETKRGSDDVI